jgi:flavin-dependent dehydrogenase
VVGPRKNTDVFIVGAGPAGLAAAITTRQKGLQVIVADGAATPIEKPCGEGMMPGTLAALHSLGVEIDPGMGRSFRGTRFVHKGAQVAADFPQGVGIGLRRPVLHERLVARAEQCGVQLLWKTPVCGIDGQWVQIPGTRIHTRWVVGADGQGSRVRRWAGLEGVNRGRQRFASRRHYRVRPWSSYMEIHWGAHAQGYVTPIGCQEVSVVVMSDQVEHACFERALRELPELKDRLEGAALTSRERGAMTSMRLLTRVQRGNVALTGDASGSVDAITGEGLRLAFQQAFALAEAIAASDLRGYERKHRELMKRPMLMGNLLLWLSRHPQIRGRVIRALQSHPELFARLLATHVGQGNAAELLSTGAMLGLRLLAA